MIDSSYPRPQMVREKYLLLNGEWQFDFDDAGISLMEHWEHVCWQLNSKINVPFTYEFAASGINCKEPHNTVFYKKKFHIPDEWHGKQIMLHFGAVDYACKVFINGAMVFEHEGGHVGFSINVTNNLSSDEQDLSVWVSDPYDDECVPRGKQFWEESPRSIWYTRTTGIWQSVWIEPLEISHIEEIRYTPILDAGEISMEVLLSELTHVSSLSYLITFGGQQIANGTIMPFEKDISFSVDVFGNNIFRTNTHEDGMTWTPENPNLFDVQFVLHNQNSDVLDKVDSYFGMRKIHTEDGMVFLNNRPYYMKLVLDQGYWLESGMTAPTDNSFKQDIMLAKDMGFNGCRKHQKVEDQRFLYWADTIGFLVWGEMPSAISFSSKSVQRTIKECMEVISRDYNHPCIVAWVPLNESWGVSQIKHDRVQQAHSLSLYHTIKSLDDTRLVIGNDGWEQTKSDICAVHNYAHGNPEEHDKRQYYSQCVSTLEGLLSFYPSNRKLYADGYAYSGEPVMLTEFGGINIKDMSDSNESWGYTGVDNDTEFINEYSSLIEIIKDSKCLVGFCYTQLTDVEQEKNGLLTADRKAKCSMNEIKKINDFQCLSIPYIK